ncbi:hypothetical protein ALI22I_12425 [Saccharothrix sp. ALI-22-I]|uniref:LppU/SCO3897 family protein n=1 Tax=Saccharothrix sp. ALI-22-I TaxID=1933778 RepID=UPI00097C1754|nr:hypothetical protein [Saccharothrix sp. ALI-22-I]ONI90525.1 hypothetical protein ALI22I_12425 [Saccharothrix sp. ALI-22-I]
MRKIGWGVGAVAVLVAGAFAFTVLTGGPRTPEPGACARIEGEADAPKYRAMDCGSDQANVKIAKVVDDASKCPTGGAPYSTYTGSATLCLIPNLVEGACYQQDQLAGLRKVECTTADVVRVVKAATGTVTCGDDRTVRYPEPAVTFCLTRPGVR